MSRPSTQSGPVVAIVAPGDAACDKTALPQRGQTGDPEAFQLLVMSLTAQLENFAYQHLRDRQLAEDAVQETWIRVYLKDDEFQGSSIKSWIFSILLNVIRDMVRHAQRQKRGGGNVITDIPESAQSTAPEPTEAAARDERQDQLTAAIAELEVSDQHILKLAYFEQLSHADIADILELPSANSVKKRLGRLRLKLRTRLESKQ